ncbi:MAG: hypothetical protein K8S24_02500 [Candidatus Aegiribacteria sp.]|nr:hypothetical protein [Candidatus Aegiribacteria sp.]
MDEMYAFQDSLENDSTEINHYKEIPIIVRRNPGAALLRSAVLPGWGQFYNDEPLKGVVFGTASLGLLSWLISEHFASEDARNNNDEPAYQLHSQRRLDLIWYTSAAWLFGMLDAYVDAYLYPFSTENEVFEREAGIAAAFFIHF